MRRLLFTLAIMLGVAIQTTAQKTITVSADGTADYTTIQAAVDAVEDNNPTIIYIKVGTYNEQVMIGSKTNSSKKIISMIGEGIDRTILQSAIGMASGTTFDKTPALSVYATDFYCEGLTLRNTSGKNGGQALALYVAGDRQTYYRCRIAGYQDTHRSKKHTRSYYRDCIIEGATDFVYAGGTCWFEQCTLNCVGSGYITAPEDIDVYHKGPSGKNIRLGFIFSQCKVTKESNVSNNSVYLGRCWAASKCGSLFLNCNLGNVIHQKGWATMGGNDGKASYYGEYRSVDANGNLINTDNRIDWSYQLPDEDYQEICNYSLVDQYFSEQMKTSRFDPEQVIRSHHPTVGNDYAPVEDRLLAFPTARGFGKFARGGRGGKVVEVTNLNNDGEGSLRWALQQGQTNATIVFKVSGTINLLSDIRAKLKNVTIAGQTAPGQGILYRGAKLNLGGSSNLIVRNIRGRIGMSGDNFVSGGSIGIENADSLILDHCTFGWSAEENMTIYDNHFTTVQWCMVHEGLYDANHKKGVRGYGSQWGGSPATYHHNLLAHNVSRSPRINGASNADQDRNVFLEYYNNVNYNWGSTGACYGGENEAGNLSTHECNFVGNYYKPGPGTPSSGNVFISISKNRSGKTSTGPSRWYFDGNIMEGNSSANANNWLAVKNNSGYTQAQIKSDTLITKQQSYYWPKKNTYVYADYQTPTETAEQAYQNVLAKVGCINRDQTEQRIIEEVATKTAKFKGASNKGAGFIDHADDAEGYADYEVAVPYADEDHDGMADEWELLNGFDPTNPDDGNAIVSYEGYTALEVFLCSLMGEDIAIGTTFVAQPKADEARLMGTEIYNMRGILSKRLPADTQAIDISDLPRGIYIAKRMMSNHSMQCLKVVRK